MTTESQALEAIAADPAPLSVSLAAALGLDESRLTVPSKVPASPSPDPTDFCAGTLASVSSGRAGAPLTESGNRAGSGEAPASARCRTEHSKRRGGLSAGRQKSMGQAAHRSTGVRPSSAVTLSPGRIASSIQRAPGPQFTRLGGSLGRWRIPHAYQTAGLQDGHGVGPHRHPQQGRLRPQSALVHLMERSGESCDAPLITISSKSRLTVPKGSSPGEAETPWWPSAQAEPAAYGAEPLRGPLQGTDNTTEVQHHRVYAMTVRTAPGSGLDLLLHQDFSRVRSHLPFLTLRISAGPCRPLHRGRGRRPTALNQFNHNHSERPRRPWESALVQCER